MDQTALESKLPDIMEIARFAPSVHNTQPWQVKVGGADIVVSIDPAHRLSDGDPTGRQTILSLGIFCEAVRLAAESLGLTAGEVRLAGETGLVTITGESQNSAPDVAGLLRKRCTDRSIYAPAVVSAEAMAGLNGITTDPTIRTEVITDQGIIGQIADLTSKGISLALSNPSFRRELSHYLVLPWSASKRGISVRSLYLPWLLQVVEPVIMRLGIGLKAEAALEKKRWLSASGVVIILGDGDLADYWFQAGRTYLQVSLAIEAAGLSQATSAAIVEASNYHDDIEEALGTQQRILAMIRIGRGKRRRYYSPRLAAAELITSN